MSTFDRRRRLTREDWLKAAGVALGAGAGVAVMAFYAMRLILQREPLRPPPGVRPVPADAPGSPAIQTAEAPLPSPTPPPPQ